MAASADNAGGNQEGLVYTDLSNFDGATSMTMAGWFNFDDTGNATVIRKTSAYGVFLDNGPRLQFFVSDGTNSDIQWADDATFFTGYTTGVWYHIAGTWNASGRVMKLYMNGVIEPNSARITNNITEISSNSEPHTNLRHPSDGFSLNGKGSYIELWDRDLSIEEINETMMKPGSIVKNLVCHFPLTDGAYVDTQGNAGAVTASTGMTGSSLGPPVSFPQMIGS